MASIRYLTFSGLRSPIALHDAPEIEALLPRILPSWPVDAADVCSDARPFVSVASTKEGKWRLTPHTGEGKMRDWDSIDVVCDLISEMAWERLRARPELLCLHAAAIEFNGRLVVFPNARRAGKSTLAIALARLGRTLFTDDFLPIEIDPYSDAVRGIANGITPRLRLPLPQDFSRAFQSWASDNSGPGNKRYKYLTDLPLAAGMTQMPLGAVVVLDRKDEPTAPCLDPIDRAEAMTGMISQNFSRLQHAGRILTSIDALTQHVPLYRLTYSCGEEAAAWLDQSPQLHALPKARMNAAMTPRPYPLQPQIHTAPTSFDPAHSYAQVSGLTQTQVNGTLYLADQNGHAIHQHNQGAAAIWSILSEPTTLEEVTQILISAFPEVDKAQIEIDCERTLRQFADAHLIELHPSF